MCGSRKFDEKYKGKKIKRKNWMKEKVKKTKKYII